MRTTILAVALAALAGPAHAQTRPVPLRAVQSASAAAPSGGKSAGTAVRALRGAAPRLVADRPRKPGQ